jgi:hypothetical protein
VDSPGNPSSAERAHGKATTSRSIDVSNPANHSNAEESTTNSFSFLNFMDNSMVYGSSPSSITSIESCPASPSASAALLKCSLCDASGKDSRNSSHIQAPTHRFRIIAVNSNSNSSSGSNSGGSPTKQPQWNLICKDCRDRLVSVGNFFTLLRHLLQGIHSHRPKLDVYYDFLQAKRHIFYTRVGVDAAFYALCDFEAFSKKISDF